MSGSPLPNKTKHFGQSFRRPSSVSGKSAGRAKACAGIDVRQRTRLQGPAHWAEAGGCLSTAQPGRTVMVYRLNRMSFEFAEKLIRNSLLVIDRDTDWVDHKPSRTRRKAFFDTYGPVEYGKWHLGDFTRMHRCALVAAQIETGKLDDIYDAVTRLLSQVEAAREASRPRAT